MQHVVERLCLEDDCMLFQGVFEGRLAPPCSENGVGHRLHGNPQKDGRTVTLGKVIAVWVMAAKAAGPFSMSHGGCGTPPR